MIFERFELSLSDLSNLFVPSTALALTLAAALDQTVEELFYLKEDSGQ